MEPPDDDRLGLAITAVVLGFLALLWCWLPLVNLLSIACCFAVLGVSVPVLVQAGRRRRPGAAMWMALAGILLGAVALAVSVRVTVSLATGVLEFIHYVDEMSNGV